VIYNTEFGSSSVLASASFDDETSEMTITFLNGREYTYSDVLESTYEGLINAESPGKYFAQLKKELTLK
jgi:KTSC domain-containing protein